jgi:BioD-like phosphotransacetylase family protein
MGLMMPTERQTGKTTTLQALARDLTVEGRQVALHSSCQAARVMGDDYDAASRLILDRIAAAARRPRLAAELLPPQPRQKRHREG